MNKNRFPENSNCLNAPDNSRQNKVEQEILRAIREIRYGSVEVIIHDSKVVQIDCKHKIRIDHYGPGKRRQGDSYVM